LNQIKFSHDYDKLPANVKWATLLEVLPVRLENLHSPFIEYDTSWLDTATGQEGNYPLPKKGSYLLLLFLSEDGELFTTLRRETVEKKRHYTANIGNSFEVIIKCLK